MQNEQIESDKNNKTNYAFHVLISAKKITALVRAVLIIAALIIMGNTKHQQYQNFR